MTRYAMITGWLPAAWSLALAESSGAARAQSDPGWHATVKAGPVAIELTQRFDVEVLLRACDLNQPLRLSGFVLELEEGRAAHRPVGQLRRPTAYGPFLAHEWADEQDLLGMNILAMSPPVPCHRQPRSSTGWWADPQCRRPGPP